MGFQLLINFYLFSMEFNFLLFTFEFVVWLMLQVQIGYGRTKPGNPNWYCGWRMDERHSTWWWSPIATSAGCSTWWYWRLKPGASTGEWRYLAWSCNGYPVKLLNVLSFILSLVRFSVICSFSFRCDWQWGIRGVWRGILSEFSYTE